MILINCHTLFCLRKIEHNYICPIGAVERAILGVKELLHLDSGGFVLMGMRLFSRLGGLERMRSERFCRLRSELPISLILLLKTVRLSSSILVLLGLKIR